MGPFAFLGFFGFRTLGFFSFFGLGVFFGLAFGCPFLGSGFLFGAGFGSSFFGSGSFLGAGFGSSFGFSLAASCSMIKFIISAFREPEGIEIPFSLQSAFN